VQTVLFVIKTGFSIFLILIYFSVSQTIMPVYKLVKFFIILLCCTYICGYDQNSWFQDARRRGGTFLKTYLWSLIVYTHSFYHYYNVNYVYETVSSEEAIAIDIMRELDWIVKSKINWLLLLIIINKSPKIREGDFN
jgi:hypothetical protein